MKFAGISLGMPKFVGIYWVWSKGCGRAPVAGKSQSTHPPPPPPPTGQASFPTGTVDTRVRIYFPIPTEDQWGILFFLHTGQDFPRSSPVLTNLILHSLIRPVGKIKTNNNTWCQNSGCIGGHVTRSLRRWELTSLRRQIRCQLSIWRTSMYVNLTC